MIGNNDTVVLNRTQCPYPSVAATRGHCIRCTTQLLALRRNSKFTRRSKPIDSSADRMVVSTVMMKRALPSVYRDDASQRRTVDSKMNLTLSESGPAKVAHTSRCIARTCIEEQLENLDERVIMMNRLRCDEDLPPIVKDFCKS